MNFIKYFRRFSAVKNRPTVVAFTGGMGAQIISAAAYFSMRNSGRLVYADLSYFDQPEHIAAIGKPGECSHWTWQLDPFGLSLASFETSPGLTKRSADILEDGPLKLGLGLKALALPEIQSLFEIPVEVENVLPEEFAHDYLCIHVRRGDYANVASHLVADSEFISLARKFSGLVNGVVVISDSPITPDFRNAVSPYFKVAAFLDNSDAYSAHCIMRRARILICSNSQFSLIAAALNPNALVLIPKQWLGGNDRNIEAPINSRCLFQIMENGSI